MFYVFLSNTKNVYTIILFQSLLFNTNNLLTVMFYVFRSNIKKVYTIILFQVSLSNTKMYIVSSNYFYLEMTVC